MRAYRKYAAICGAVIVVAVVIVMIKALFLIS
jgi:hypothetical protein